VGLAPTLLERLRGKTSVGVGAFGIGGGDRSVHPSGKELRRWGWVTPPNAAVP